MCADANDRDSRIINPHLWNEPYMYTFPKMFFSFLKTIQQI